AGRHIPLLVKIAPDLADEDVLAIAGLAVELGLDGIIATNTTISRGNLGSPAEEIAAAGPGGLSGAPLRHRSLAVLRLMRERAGPHITLVSVGGIDTATEARRRLAAGATLLQAYTGLVYGGPLWPSRLVRELGARPDTPASTEVSADVRWPAARRDRGAGAIVRRDRPAPRATGRLGPGGRSARPGAVRTHRRRGARHTGGRLEAPVGVLR